jgi:selenocysteine lyase/cysteine desulfurase
MTSWKWFAGAAGVGVVGYLAYRSKARVAGAATGAQLDPSGGPPPFEAEPEMGEALCLPAPQGLLPVIGRDLQTPLLGGGQVRYANLDYAASAPTLASVHDAVESLSPWYASMRGTGYASSACSDVLACARESIRSFVGAREDDEIVLVRNTTDALNLLAAALPPNTTVVSFASEHHANLLPWKRLGKGSKHVLLPVPRSHDEIVERADRALASAKTKNRLLTVTGASNVTGETWPLERLSAVAKKRKARFAVDAAQLAPHRPIDMEALGIDWLALSGHKLYAPYGSGVLVGRSDWLDKGTPYLAGGGAVAGVTETSVKWLSGPARHEAGTANLFGTAALGAACRALQEVGMDKVAAHERLLLDRALKGLSAIPGVHVLSSFGDGSDRIGVVAFTIDGMPQNLVSAALSAEWGIGVRDGAFCAHPLAAVLLAGTPNNGAVRASFGVGTTTEDIDRLIAAVSSLAIEGPKLAYRPEHGAYVPAEERRLRPTIHPLLDRLP